MCFVYVFVPNLVYLFLVKGAFVHGIFYDACFIFILGCVITIAYFVHKQVIMGIIVNLDKVMVDRKISSKDLAAKN